MPWMNLKMPSKEEVEWFRALARVEEQRSELRKKVSQSLALRTAQIKYLINRGLQSRWNEWTRVAATHPLFPPMQENKVIDYALRAHALFQPTIYQEWLGKASRLSPQEQQAFVAWLSEWEEVLDEMRRMTVQNLSSMPEEKIAEELARIQQWDDERQAEKKKEIACMRAAQSCRESAADTMTDINAMEQAHAFIPIRRGVEALHEWQAQKQSLEQEWMRNWEAIQPIMEILSNETLLLEKMELSAIQLLQNYVKNPWQARARDAHASGLKMLMEVAMHEVKKNEWPLPTAQMHEYARRLEKTREGKFFEYYFWKANEVESNGQVVRKELDSNPEYRKWLLLRAKVAQAEEQARRWEEDALVASTRHAQLERQITEKIHAINAAIPEKWKWKIAE